MLEWASSVYSAACQKETFTISDEHAIYKREGVKQFIGKTKKSNPVMYMIAKGAI
jgi:hypothetical protein